MPGSSVHTLFGTRLATRGSSVPFVLFYCTFHGEIVWMLVMYPERFAVLQQLSLCLCPLRVAGSCLLTASVSPCPANKHSTQRRFLLVALTPCCAKRLQEHTGCHKRWISRTGVFMPCSKA